MRRRFLLVAGMSAASYIASYLATEPGSRSQKIRDLSTALMEEALGPGISWERVSAGWPSTVKQVRGSVMHNGVLHVSTGGSELLDAQCWRLESGVLVKHSHFDNTRMNVLLSGPDGCLYMGLGSPHVAGSAFACKYDVNNVYSQIGPKFAGQDVIYSMCWHDGALHVGTMAEDSPGAARVYRWDGSWVPVFAPGMDGLPSSYSYAAAYELWVWGGMLHVGMFTRTPGEGHVWRRTSTGWVNLGNPIPDSTIALAQRDFGGKMVVAFSGEGSSNPVRYLDGETWVPLAPDPVEWSGAYIFNHLAIHKDRLYVGVGGQAGKMSVWRLEDEWVKVAGGGLYGSWPSPMGDGVNEWVYRLESDGETLYACLAGSNAAASVWRANFSPS